MRGRKRPGLARPEGHQISGADLVRAESGVALKLMISGGGVLSRSGGSDVGGARGCKERGQIGILELVFNARLLGTLFCCWSMIRAGWRRAGGMRTNRRADEHWKAEVRLAQSFQGYH